jgi:hypothetical protein
MYSIYDNKTGKKVDGYFRSWNDAMNFIKNMAFLCNCGTSRWKIVECVKSVFNF